MKMIAKIATGAAAACLVSWLISGDVVGARPAQAQLYSTYGWTPVTQWQEERYTVQRPVWRTEMQQQQVTVQRPVYETSMQTKTYTVRKPVEETSQEVQTVTVRKPVYETSSRVETVTVYDPVTTYVQTYVGFGTWEMRPVTTMAPRLETRSTPVQTVRYVEEQEDRTVTVKRIRYEDEIHSYEEPVQTVRYVEETEMRDVPVQVQTMEEQEMVRRVPVTTYQPTAVTAYRPLWTAPAPVVVYRPNVYVPGQPVRNVLRAVFP